MSIELNDGIPEEFAVICKNLMGVFPTGQEIPATAKPLLDWLEVDGFDALTSDFGDEYALNLSAVSGQFFEDSEMRDHLGLDDEEAISDDDRVAFARSVVETTIAECDGYLVPSVHAFGLTSRGPDSVVLGCIVEIHGQAGPAVTWYGLYPSRDSFLNDLRDSDWLWPIEFAGPIPDAKLLAQWSK